MWTQAADNTPDWYTCTTSRDIWETSWGSLYIHPVTSWHRCHRRSNTSWQNVHKNQLWTAPVYKKPIDTDAQLTTRWFRVAVAACHGTTVTHIETQTAFDLLYY